MLLPRILTALIGIPLMLFLIHQGSIPFLVFVMGIIFLSLYEYRIVLICGGKEVQKYLVLGGGVFLALGTLNKNLFSPLLILLITCSFVGEMLRNNRSLERIAMSLLGTLLIGWTLSHLFLLRNLRPYGESLTYLLVFCIWIMDSVAYFAGSWIGRKKLAPSLSPGKSWEGAMAGFLGAVGTSYGFCFLFLHGIYSGWAALAMGSLIGIFGQISDLAESMIKRSSGVKDSGYLLPGHGGILDRFDSFLLTTPLLYYMITFLF
ncbi:MAG: phosphatidate cytidylyltransferase [Elusimicrobia bacterium]|nr:phosphatidate cytidylyltransferase [Elusimicrobiota bacterium]